MKRVPWWALAVAGGALAWAGYRYLRHRDFLQWAPPGLRALVDRPATIDQPIISVMQPQLYL